MSTHVRSSLYVRMIKLTCTDILKNSQVSLHITVEFLLVLLTIASSYVKKYKNKSKVNILELEGYKKSRIIILK